MRFLPPRLLRSSAKRELFTALRDATAFLIYFVACSVLAKQILRCLGDDVHTRETLLGGIFLAFLIPTRKLFLLFVLPLCMLAALYGPIAYIYGQPDYQSLISVLATNASEAAEFLSFITPSVAQRSILVLALVLVAAWIAKRFSLQPWRNKTCVIAGVATVVLLYCPTAFFSNLTRGISVTQQDLSQLQQYVSHSSWGESSLYNPAGIEDFILVVGESVRRDYLGAYGYPLDNTPFISRTPGILVNGLTAGDVFTVGSLRLMLTQADVASWSPRYDFNIVDLAKSAGMETIWLSNQGFIGLHDTPISSIGMRADHYSFPTMADSSSTNFSDMVLLPKFHAFLTAKAKTPRLFVIHTIGSHPKVCRRIFDLKEHYQPASSEFETVACYLDSIRKTDLFLQKVVDMLRQKEADTGRKFSMLYFADHGQVHRKMPNGYISIDNNSTSFHHFEIPLLLIDSDSREHIVQKASKYGVRFVDGLAHWIGISNRHLLSYDLFDGVSDPEDYGFPNVLASKNPIQDPVYPPSTALKTLLPQPASR